MQLDRALYANGEIVWHGAELAQLISDRIAENSSTKPDQSEALKPLYPSRYTQSLSRFFAADC